MKAFVRSLQSEPVAIAASSLPGPIVTYLVQDKTWRLEAPYSYRHGGNTIRVPALFEFDLASIPRSFWWLVAPFELSIAAPLLHDFLYRYGGKPPEGAIAPPRTYTREEADLLFREVMAEEGVPAWRRFAAYRAVRWFGGQAWSRGARPGVA